MTYDAALDRDGAKYGTIVKDAFARRGITFSEPHRRHDTALRDRASGSVPELFPHR